MLLSESVMIDHLEMNPPFPSLTEYEEIAMSMHQILTTEIRTLFCGGEKYFFNVMLVTYLGHLFYHYSAAQIPF